MIERDIEKYICIECGQGGLSIERAKEDAEYGHIIDGVIRCSNCGEIFHVSCGIPRFASGANYADSFGYQWNIHAKTQLDSYTGKPISRNRLFSVTGWPENLEGQTILEAGSGAGRFTEILLSTGAEVFSFDYSSAVEANWSNNGHFPNLHLFQGDIYKIPLKERSFDKVICLGVLQHTPDPEKAFRNLVRYLKPGGQIVIDIYRKDLISLLQWKYFLRPITRRLDKKFLYRLIEVIVPVILPVAAFFRYFLGRVGARIFPITEYSHLGLPSELNKQWAILDTFDMYSPAYDRPQTVTAVERWFKDARLVDISVCRGTNGIIGKGYYPK